MFGINDTNNQQVGGTGAMPAPPAGPSESISNPIQGSSEPTAAAPITTPPALAATDGGSTPDNLLELKKKALDSLAPMVNKLDQKPEEKFKTLMMLIQASDNSSLVGQAYEAANQIPDERERAQALIDVVNEINYFTQTKNQS